MANKKIIKKKKYYKKELKKLLNIDLDFLIIDNFSLTKLFKGGIATINYNKSKDYYHSHFINDPTMPGTLQTEAMLQTIVSIVYLSDFNINKCLITKYKLSFINKIEKSSKLTVSANIKLFKRGIINASASISNNTKKFSYGEFNFIIPEIFKL
tara:strand:+ start:321 stop:782 length:462 start_codon:yes stop_codon:yes gene_type:complete